MKFQNKKQFFIGIAKLTITYSLSKQQAYISIDVNINNLSIIKVDNLNCPDIMDLRRVLKRKISKYSVFVKYLFCLYQKLSLDIHSSRISKITNRPTLPIRSFNDIFGRDREFD